MIRNAPQIRSCSAARQCPPVCRAAYKYSAHVQCARAMCICGRILHMRQDTAYAAGDCICGRRLHMRQDTAYAAGVCICGRTLHMRQDTAYAAGDCICGRRLHMQQDARLTLVVSPVSCLLSRLTVRGLLLSTYAYSVQRTNIARTCNMHEAYSCRGLLSCLLSRLTLRGLLLSAYAAGYGAYSCRAQADGGRVAT